MNFVHASIKEIHHAMMGVESIKEALQSISMATIMGVNKANAEFRVVPNQLKKRCR
jgi:hypothetical protein